MAGGLEDAIKRACAAAYEIDPRDRQVTNPRYASLAGVLGPEIERHHILGQLIGRFCIGPGGGGPVQAFTLALTILDRAVSNEDPVSVVADFVEFSNDPQTSVITVTCLSGVVADREIALSRDTRLVPPTLLPASSTRRRLFPTDGDLTQIMPSMAEVVPTAALTQQWHMNDCLLTDEDIVKAMTEAQRSEPSDDEVQKAVAALTLAAKSSVQKTHRYSEALHPGFPSFSGGYSLFPATPLWPREPKSTDENELRRIAAQIDAFQDWPELSRLTRRLSAAMAKRDRVDAHIDIGIVAECALTKGDGRETEISQRLRTRCAWLLGTTPEQRKSKARAMRNLYDRRSSAAHKGVVDGKGVADFEADLDLCREILLAILERGNFPKSDDWNDLVFG